MGGKAGYVGAAAGTEIDVVWAPLEVLFWLIFSMRQEAHSSAESEDGGSSIEGWEREKSGM